MNKMVTIPQTEYDRLREAAEDLADLRAFDGAKAALSAFDHLIRTTPAEAAPVPAKEVQDAVAA